MLRYQTTQDCNESELIQKISETYGISTDQFYLTQNGKKLNSDKINKYDTVNVVPRILGGKGGFGSMLRAIGAQIEKTTNREACRDLSGRRLRDINAEQRLKSWIAQNEEREKEQQLRKKKRLERLCQEPKIEFKDEEYEKHRSDLTENISSSLEQGLKAGSSTGVKRKSEDVVQILKKKPRGLLLDDDDLSSCSDASSDDENTDSSLEDNSSVQKNSSEDIEREVATCSGR